jgi:ABC-type nitrate/sulfonate/bicarbonate transport system ATPase subunit
MTLYTEAEILLHVEDVTKSYGEKLVLKKVNAIIRDIRVIGEVKGQVVGFIGPSGIGKSTLIRIMAGLDQPTSGRVLLDAQTRPVRAGEVGLVAQAYPLFPHRTVKGNLIRAARKSMARDAAIKAVEQYLLDFDLYDVSNRYPWQLSGGQRQRCAILQQILVGHAVIMMDEPFSGLDPIAKKKTQVLIRKIADLDEKNSIVVVTHDITAAAIVSDHIWALGREHTQDGKPLPGAYIVETYNLIDKGLAWMPDIDRQPTFTEFVWELTDRFGRL